MAPGWTTARADHGPPRTLGQVEMVCRPSPVPGQRRQRPPARGASARSSPVMTQERVMGSLRSSIREWRLSHEGISDQFSTSGTGGGTYNSVVSDQLPVLSSQFQLVV